MTLQIMQTIVIMLMIAKTLAILVVVLCVVRNVYFPYPARRRIFRYLYIACGLAIAVVLYSIFALFHSTGVFL